MFQPVGLDMGINAYRYRAWQHSVKQCLQHVHTSVVLLSPLAAVPVGPHPWGANNNLTQVQGIVGTCLNTNMLLGHVPVQVSLERVHKRGRELVLLPLLQPRAGSNDELKSVLKLK